MFNNKPIRVILLEEAKQEYDKLCGIVQKQADANKSNTSEMQLLRSINQKINFLKADPFYGDNIPKQIIPSIYNAGNLWRIELCHFWRMIYTIKGDKIEIICFVLDILSHKDYDKKFGYQKK